MNRIKKIPYFLSPILLAQNTINTSKETLINFMHESFLPSVTFLHKIATFKRRPLPKIRNDSSGCMNASPQQTKTEKGPLFEHTKRFNEKNLTDSIQNTVVKLHECFASTNHNEPSHLEQHITLQKKNNFFRMDSPPHAITMDRRLDR